MKRVSYESREAIKRYKKIADRYGLTMTQLALGFVTGTPGVSSAIIGARSPKQLEEAAQACLTEITPKMQEQIDRVLAPGEYIVSYYTAKFGPNLRPNV
jgi:aryl-alcohol dehydrogenase-like predicted oxidoreductase